MSSNDADDYESDDEEIDEDLAFNSDDEKKFGGYFRGTPSSPSSRRSSSSSAEEIPKKGSRNVSLSIPLQHNTVRVVDVERGSKLTLSSVCLDVSDARDFHQIKLLHRNSAGDDAMAASSVDFCCLCNYLSVERGGAGLPPSTSLNLDVAGPCKVVFRVEVAVAKSSKGKGTGSGGINIFGVVAPVDHAGAVGGGGCDGDFPFQYADAFMSDDEDFDSDGEDVDSDDEEMDSDAESIAESEIEAIEIMQSKRIATKKRKSEQMEEEEQLPSNGQLSKSQRKKLAKEKARQLEDTLSAAREADGKSNGEEAPSTAKKTKKKKKKSGDAGDDTGKAAAAAIAPSKSTSMTRERRLPDGILVSDILLGTGAPVKSGKRISLHYTGRLRSTGGVFDRNQSKQHPLVFRQGTGEVIRGLERGLEGMKAGGERVVTIPSRLGYGRKGAGADVPPDSDLVFEVKVLKVG